MRTLVYSPNHTKPQNSHIDSTTFQFILLELYQQIVCLVKLVSKGKINDINVPLSLKEKESNDNLVKASLQLIAYLLKKYKQDNPIENEINSTFISDGSLLTPSGITYSGQEYHSLEATLQKVQCRNRNLIKVHQSILQSQQTIKLYCEELELKLTSHQKSSQQMLKSTKQNLLDLKRENQRLLEDNQRLKLYNETVSNKNSASDIGIRKVVTHKVKEWAEPKGSQDVSRFEEKSSIKSYAKHEGKSIEQQPEQNDSLLVRYNRNRMSSDSIRISKGKGH